MDGVVGYVAEIIEFLVAGVVTGLAVFAAVWAFSPSTLESFLHSTATLPAGLGPAPGMIALALLYALGVFVEGVSRQIMEWDLRLLTTNRYGTIGQPSSRWPRRPEGANAAEKERELRRHWASGEANGKLAIETQLKRLRVERSLLMALMITTLAMLFSAHWVWLLISASLTMMTGFLVHERFGRYLSAIDRAFEARSHG